MPLAMGMALSIKCLLSLKVCISNYGLPSLWDSPLNYHLLKFIILCLPFCPEKSKNEGWNGRREKKKEKKKEKKRGKKWDSKGRLERRSRNIKTEGGHTDVERLIATANPKRKGKWILKRKVEKAKPSSTVFSRDADWTLCPPAIDTVICN